jgi:hypothetical protein
MARLPQAIHHIDIADALLRDTAYTTSRCLARQKED